MEGTRLKPYENILNSYFGEGASSHSIDKFNESNTRVNWIYKEVKVTDTYFEIIVKKFHWEV